MRNNGTYYAPGEWNVTCDRCGSTRKLSQVRKQWNNLIVCTEHWEPRQPQDFVRGRPDRQAVPTGWARPEPDDTFLSTNEVQASDL